MAQPKRLNWKEIEATYPDGTWLITDSHLTCVMATRDATESRPRDLGMFVWRRKQLTDQLKWMETQRKADAEFRKAFTPNKHGEYQ